MRFLSEKMRLQEATQQAEERVKVTRAPHPSSESRKNNLSDKKP
jgi:hypothetical protein